MSRKGSSSRSPSERGVHNGSIVRSRSRSIRKRSYSRSRSGSTVRSPYRSRSRSYHSYRKGRYTRSRTRSYSRSRSPSYGRSKKHSSSGQPKPNRCLGVFGLSLYTNERQIRDIFEKYGNLDKVQVIYDAKTGRSRGFCFVYYDSVADAKYAKEKCSGMEIDGRKIRVDFSITQRAHTPTPGIYMGNPTYVWDDRRMNRKRYDDYGRGSYRRSPSPYYRGRRYGRSRSRSYSPRRY